MTSSGTEAAMSAVRLARAVTGREVVVKFAGAYHGHSDGLLAEAGSGLATLGDPGQPRRHRGAGGRRPSSCPGTTARRSPRALAEHAVAALLAEPIAANMGVVPPAEGFLEFLREATRDAGALLVFDEVITGFRVARGGAQELYGVEPDLTVLGKVLGGGLPAAAFGGPRELMERIAPAGDVYQAGTLSGNPLAVAAGLATLRAARRRRLRAARRAHRPPRRRLRDARRRPAAAGRRGPRPASPSSSAPSRCATSPTPAPATLEAHARFCRALLDRGVYPPPSQFEAWFVSLAHDEATIDRTLEAAAEALEEALRVSDAQPPPCATLAAPAARGGHADLPARGRPGRAAGASACSPPPARAPPRPRASTRWWSRRSARATSSTTASRACSPATTPTSPCSPATTSTRSASTASPRSATSAPSPSSPT